MRDFLEDGCFTGQTALVTGGARAWGWRSRACWPALGARVRHRQPRSVAPPGFCGGSRARGLAGHGRGPGRARARRGGRVCEAVAARFGSLDILVNNAAGNFIRPALALPPKGWRAVIDIALSGVFYCSQAAARVMRAQEGGGSIVNIIAPYAWTGCPGVVHSRSGQSRRAGHEAGHWPSNGRRHKIRVNCLAPGPFESEGAARAFMADGSDAAGHRGPHSSGRLGRRGGSRGARRCIWPHAGRLRHGGDAHRRRRLVLGQSLSGEADVEGVRRRRV